ncbi:hypothetical protein CC80DRAFT_258773 [Byssothecium circinans]|uniref:Uncharacterized protein n=1 Tax=Byssothecium circinans TaxID=147558 RepID=A0A6A5U751_9PLEO|nr:hypothetical protein CC80DRAFT_258773 [Byssothecium circinans]
MNGGISKARTTRRSHVTLSKALQETLLAAIANSSAELLPNPRDQPPVDGDISPEPDAPFRSTKRLLDVTSDVDPLPVKRTRLAQTDTQQPGVEEEASEQADKAADSTTAQAQAFQVSIRLISQRCC